ncbi:UNKNOWN [Stylonychia lemnae]|uniref:Uncharacterized protein n=1 Tax=Stylonychia lemnae TaxID=5949 RepID=A0A078AKZ8_STYLE|nr:UNKNOWN [Stylonychia lemnae]|eukprot:CDW82112.1 UNKNOWN [Stylonychia lemnae]
MSSQQSQQLSSKQTSKKSKIHPRPEWDENESEDQLDGRLRSKKFRGNPPSTDLTTDDGLIKLSQMDKLDSKINSAKQSKFKELREKINQDFNSQLDLNRSDIILQTPIHLDKPLEVLDIVNKDQGSVESHSKSKDSVESSTKQKIPDSKAQSNQENIVETTRQSKSKQKETENARKRIVPSQSLSQSEEASDDEDDDEDYNSDEIKEEVNELQDDNFNLEEYMKFRSQLDLEEQKEQKPKQSLFANLYAEDDESEDYYDEVSQVDAKSKSKSKIFNNLQFYLEQQDIEDDDDF